MEQTARLPLICEKAPSFKAIAGGLLGEDQGIMEAYN